MKFTGFELYILNALCELLYQSGLPLKIVQNLTVIRISGDR